MILRQGSCNTIMKSSEMTSPLSSLGLTFFVSPTSLYLCQGGTCPVSGAPSRWGSIRTPAAWRCWTTRWRSKEAWRGWRMSLRRWQMPSVFCHDDPPPPQWSVSTLLLFGSSPLRSATCDKTNTFIFLYLQLWCCFSWVIACLTLAGWLTRLQPNKTSNRSAGDVSKDKTPLKRFGSIRETMGFYWPGNSCF